MTREALEIMLRIWTEDEPWEHRGKYWNANGIAPMFEGLMRRHIKPYQKPHPPIGVTGSAPARRPSSSPANGVTSP